LNTYGYVGGNPGRYTDKYGLESPIDWDLPGEPAYVNATLGVGASFTLVMIGLSADTGLYFSTSGKVCLYVNGCVRYGPGAFAGAGFVGGIGVSEACDDGANLDEDGFNVTGYSGPFEDLGSGIAGGASLNIGDDLNSFSGGKAFGGVGGGAAAGYQRCGMITFLCI